MRVHRAFGFYQRTIDSCHEPLHKRGVAIASFPGACIFTVTSNCLEKRAPKLPKWAKFDVRDGCASTKFVHPMFGAAGRTDTLRGMYFTVHYHTYGSGTLHSGCLQAITEGSTSVVRG